MERKARKPDPCVICGQDCLGNSMVGPTGDELRTAFRLPVTGDNSRMHFLCSQHRDQWQYGRFGTSTQQT